MAATKVIQVLRERVLRGEINALSDAALLRRFLVNRDDDAFAALVRRHANLVWGVCMRALQHRQDAEDAFQATFLVLCRKAASIQPPGMLANWLYGVAHHTALKARALNAKRQAREKPMPEVGIAAAGEPERWSDLKPILDHELNLLPDKYRAVIVLCDLLGKTRAEAATQLGVPDGTVAGRLARARALLGKRLARRGITISAVALTVALGHAASATAPLNVVAATLLTGSGSASAGVAALVDAVLNAMLIAKLRSFAVTVCLLVVLLASGIGALAIGTAERGGDDVHGNARTKPAPQPIHQPNKERPAPAQNDLDRLQGSWRLAQIEFRDSEIWTIDGDTLREGPGDKLLRTVALRSDQTPKQIDIRVQADPDGPIVVEHQGIYDLDGDTLKLYLGVGKRPAAFPKAADPGVIILQRVDAKKVPPVVEPKTVDQPKKEPPRLRPVRFTEGSGYEWRGIFATDDARKRVFLCNPDKLVERIELTERWSATVLKEWAKQRDRLIECYSRKDEAPLDLYRLVDPKKVDKKADPDKMPADTGDYIINKPFLQPDSKQKYVGPSTSYLIEGNKKTPIEQVKWDKVKGSVTLEFTGGSYSYLPEFSPGGGFTLSSYWEAPPRIRISANGWVAQGLRLPKGGVPALVGMRMRVSGNFKGGMITIEKLKDAKPYAIEQHNVRIEYLGRDQSWQAAQEEFKKLQGQWKGSNGKDDMKILFDRMPGTNAGDLTVLRVDPSKNPKEIDLYSVRGGLTAKAIYKLENDTLTIGFPDYNQRRPKGFTKEQGAATTHVYRRDPNYMVPPRSEQPYRGLDDYPFDILPGK